jgi:phosphoribosyl 1,2-cyclic phosphodiesterase
MKLKVLGSSSSGNCYILDNGKEALVLEAGVPFAEVKKALDFDISRIVACLVSHEHGDHARYVSDYLKAQIPVYTSQGTIDALGIHHKLLRPVVMENDSLTRAGGFRISAFRTKHDAAAPVGFLIGHAETGVVLFATDTYYLEYTFAVLHNILIECNYSLDILDANTQNGSIPKPQRDRTIQSHMSLDTCIETLRMNDLSAVNNIVLIHLSDSNSNAEAFQAAVREATGKTIHIASKGLDINFNKTPF